MCCPKTLLALDLPRHVRPNDCGQSCTRRMSKKATSKSENWELKKYPGLPNFRVTRNWGRNCNSCEGGGSQVNALESAKQTWLLSVA